MGKNSNLCHGSRGCRKHPRYPSKYCRIHEPTITQECIKEAVSPNVAKTDKGQSKMAPLEKGFLKAFTLDKNLKEKIIKFTEGWGAKILEQEPSLEERCRQRVPIQNMKDHGIICPNDYKRVMKMLQSITDNVTKEIPGYCKSGERMRDAELIIAPRVSSRSNEWTCGVIHRDIECNKQGLVLSVAMALDKVTQGNGSIRFWPESIHTPCDPKHRKRYVEKLTYEDLTVEKGTVTVWDARMLHQSLPNKDNETTIKISWYIVSKSYVPKQGAVTAG